MKATRTMRIQRTALPAVLAALMLLTACTGAWQAPDADKVMKGIIEAQAFAELTDMDDQQLVEYLGLPEGSYGDIAAAFDISRVTPEAVIIVTAKDKDQVAPVKQALQDYLDNLLEEYRTYRPEEMPKLEAASVRVKGAQLALVISPDDALADKALKDLWK